MRPTGNWRPAFDERDTDFFAFSLAASPLTLDDIFACAFAWHIKRASGARQRLDTAAGW